LTQTDRRRLEAFEMWIWRRMEKISWLDKVTIDEVLRRVNEGRQILNFIWQKFEKKHRWIGHVSRHDGLLHEITKGRMRGKPTRGRRRIQMIHYLANDGGFVALKRAAEDREDGDTEKGCQKPALQQKTTDD